MTKNTHL